MNTIQIDMKILKGISLEKRYEDQVMKKKEPNNKQVVAGRRRQRQQLMKSIIDNSSLKKKKPLYLPVNVDNYVVIGRE
ncbi:hypothetical protein DERP_014147 [Dermatophagoides pteronyssinus]|uniref:Uncharacterized protein n=1 Tax=Dermatophagoides pteronyssinus TaxID=6956 RepID=A0ABQ8IXD0_DERPT|nr:hypothetical protein DERP_014147 [Dermatophagoides pteronyssinus]